MMRSGSATRMACRRTSISLEAQCLRLGEYARASSFLQSGVRLVNQAIR